MNALRHLIVAVPARNEAERLAACLQHLVLARRQVLADWPGLDVQIVVALDSCTDGSDEIAARYPLLAVPTTCGSVGAARDTAIRAGLAQLPAPALRSVWIANTDADSTVGPRWLSTQVALAEAGWDLVIGTVEPVGDIDPVTLDAWLERHSLTEGHRHVHGANLGVRASAWQLAGGFGDRMVHEDLQLVRALQFRVPFIATDRTRVLTSARRVSRVEGGFAQYLNHLEAIR